MHVIRCCEIDSRIPVSEKATEDMNAQTTYPSPALPILANITVHFGSSLNRRIALPRFDREDWPSIR